MLLSPPGPPTRGSLQRLLREEGTTFEAIKDETRRDFAQRYLSHPDVPLTQVSALLD